MSSEQAILAGGCFWGMQDLIRKQLGIISTKVGYTGGDIVNATYRNHGSHAEAIIIEFDTDLVTYRDILVFFFQIHDPTTPDQQGNDRGASYRSEIFYLSKQQQEIALDCIENANISGRWPGPIVTKVSSATEFWDAEDEHQNYIERYPQGYTCHFIRPDWVLTNK